MSDDSTLLKEAPGYAQITRLALPIILANAAQPLLGLADTAIIGRTGTESDLGGIALGTLIFSFVYWGFGFLRMSTTGFVAQSLGARDGEGVRATVGRALLLALIIGLGLILMQSLISSVAFLLLDGSAAVRSTATEYFYTRIWGAPATLANFAVFGALIGLGKTRLLLLLQLLLNGLNLGLNLIFVVGLSYGVRGIALGTILAEYLSVGVGLWLVYISVRSRSGGVLWPWPRIMEAAAWKHTLTTNTDIMWRTLFLLGGFGWFTNQSARFGDELLAVNHILLQIVTFSTFFLDGFAFVVEALVGQTLGSGRADLFRTTLIRSTFLAGLTALGLALLVLVGGGWLLRALTDLEGVVLLAEQYLPYTALYIALSFAAFQLDGVFVGATRSREMRNTAVLSTGLLVAISLLLTPLWGNVGLWISFICFVVIRAITLGAFLPRLMRETRTSTAATS